MISEAFQEVYTFQAREGGYSITHFRGNTAVKSYVLIGDRCSCPGGVHEKPCKHKKMLAGDYIKDDIAAFELNMLVQSLQKDGLPVTMPEDGPNRYESIILEDATREGLFVGLATIRKKQFVVYVKGTKDDGKERE